MTNVYKIQSIDRAFTILDLLSNTGKSLSLDEIANGTELNRNTAYKILSSLCSWNVVRYDKSKGYSLGTQIVRYYKALNQSLPLIELTRNFLIELSETTNETVGLCIEQNFHRTCIDQVEGNHIVRRVLNIGKARPIYIGSGKIFLAYKSNNQRDEYLKDINEISYCSGKVLSKKEFYQMLDKTKEDGFTISVSEGYEDVWSVAAPVFGIDHEVIACILVTSPITRYNPTNEEFYKNETISISKKVSEKIQERFNR